jgi:iron complex transport system substrate-binding protein
MRYLLFLLALTTLFSLEGRELSVVSLSPALTELVCYLGKESCLVGRSDVCNYPVSVKKLPVAGRLAQPFTEKVLSLKPSLVIANDFINPGVKNNFERAGIKSLQLPCRNLDEYRRCVEILGKELHASEAAAKEIRRIDELKNKKIKKKNLQVLWVVWDTPLLTPGRRSHLHEVLTLAGAENATGGFDQEYMRPSFDNLLKKKIDVILWSASSSGWKQRRVWQKFPAVKNNRVLDKFDQDVLLRPGPRMIGGIEELEKMFEQWNR